MAKPDADEIMKTFHTYVDEWQQLEYEYNRIPGWPIYHFIRQQINLSQRKKLTDAYTKQMNEWGIV